eukprot:CAMPEP_0181343542 /NCGR_PEP_ID=MMETSP1101-20121128/31644_1 /TAXON_ID=46948 /ORGANISM="Rhodomonas abbreviata, Strain Caron Lab Isolate" /LENGTH=86 /DNA_ID=CAMNT_0023455183 /DNA_START=367 /DNA_END=623 /DNA_ORIENTATION=-
MDSASQNPSNVRTADIIGLQMDSEPLYNIDPQSNDILPTNPNTIFLSTVPQAQAQHVVNITPELPPDLDTPSVPPLDHRFAPAGGG